MAYQVNDVVQAMQADSGLKLGSLKADGGASANNLLLQTQADLCQAPVLRPCCVETTAMGAAYLAGLAVGYWQNLEAVRANWKIDRIFEPEIQAEEQQQRMEQWHRAVRTSMGWAKT